MKTKRILTAFFFCSLVWPVSAQTQQGYVKTLGRPGQKGVALSGVSVRARGGHNAVLSGSNGTFVMPLPGKKEGDTYQLQQVQKAGYELNDLGMVGRSFAFSARVTLTLVMVSTRQLQADKQRIENNAYQVAARNYKTRLASLERQRTANSITIEQYRQEVQQLQDRFDKYQSLIDDLADHYAHVDYDQLDARERDINSCIEAGDLERAEMLLRQLGVQQRAEEISRRQQAGQQLLAEANADMAAVLKQQEKDAEHLYQLYTIALGRLDYEKAAIYIETRAALDTKNIMWQTEAGDYLDTQNQTKRALVYYQRAINEYNKSEVTDKDKMFRAGVYDQLGNIYRRLNYPNVEAEKAYMMSLTLFKELVDKYNTVGFAALYAGPLTNLAALLDEKGREQESLNLYDGSLLPLLEEIVAQDEYFKSDLAAAYGNAAILYKQLNYFDKSKLAYLKALNIYREIVNENSQEYKDKIANNLIGLSDLFIKLHCKDDAKECILEAVPIMRQLAKLNSQRFESDLAYSLKFLGNYYRESKNNNEAKEAYTESIEIYRRLATSNMEEYERQLASTLGEAALLYSNMHLFEESEYLYKETLNIRRRQVESNPSVYEVFLASELNNFGIMYFSSYQYGKSEPLYRESLSLYRKLNKESPRVHQSNLSHVLCNLAITDIFLKKYSESQRLFEESIEICKKLEKSNPKAYAPFISQIIGNYAVLFLYMGEYSKAEKIFRKAIAKDNSSTWMKGFLAVTLIFQGNKEDAFNIIRKYKSDLKESLIDNLEKMEMSGVVPAQYVQGINEMKDMLR